MAITIKVTHLEMTDRAEFRPARDLGERLEVNRAELPLPEFNRFLYASVGREWHWRDRLGWSRERWTMYLDRAEVQTWVGYVQGTPVGYFELEQQADSNVEIVYFGLLPDFVGRGLGGRLLSAAIRSAWETGARRVWVHTCDLDHPSALKNYLARGFRVFKTETESKDYDLGTIPAWPG